jgi:hypothetical protein
MSNADSVNKKSDGRSQNVVRCINQIACLVDGESDQRAVVGADRQTRAVCVPKERAVLLLVLLLLLLRERRAGGEDSQTPTRLSHLLSIMHIVRIDVAGSSALALNTQHHINTQPETRIYQRTCLQSVGNRFHRISVHQTSIKMRDQSNAPAVMHQSRALGNSSLKSCQ